MKIDIYSRSDLDPREYLRLESLGELPYSEKRGYLKVNTIDVDMINSSRFEAEVRRNNYNLRLKSYIKNSKYEKLKLNKASKIPVFFTTEIVNNKIVYYSYQGDPGLVIVHESSKSDNEVSLSDFLDLMNVSDSEASNFNIQAEDYSLWKALRTITVENIVVEVNGKRFDGDELSQSRMVRAIIIAEATGDTSVNWKLSDNSILPVTINELKQALTLAGETQLEAWF